MKLLRQGGLGITFWIPLFLLLLFSDWSNHQPTVEQKIQNIKTFSSLYGYVRYFHPSEEASTIDFESFAVFGIQRVENCKSSSELKAALKELFLPIAPTIEIFSTGQKQVFLKRDIEPTNTAGYKPVFWQHLGFGLGNSDNVYKSIRVNSSSYVSDLFSKKIQLGESTEAEIGNGLSVIIPLALYGNDKGTYPFADSTLLKKLKHNMASSKPQHDDPNLRRAVIMICWNIFQHFYPYFDEAKTDWDNDLSVALQETYGDQNPEQYVLTLKKFTAKLKDGHGRAGDPLSAFNYRLPIDWELVEGKLIITDTDIYTNSVKRGEIVLSIDGQPQAKYFDDLAKSISSATAGFTNFLMAKITLYGDQNSVVKLSIEAPDGTQKSVELVRNIDRSKFHALQEGHEVIRKIENSIYYIDLKKASMEEIENKMPVLAGASSIICDLRGYPNRNSDFLRHLLTKPDTSIQWMRIPKIVYPDRKNWEFQNWGWQLTPLEPHLKGKIIFITDASAISYAESFMSFIEHYNLATIIGQPTAGTNGNINRFSIFGFNFVWTGMKVVKHDGSQHHGVGIIPHIYVIKTIKGVRENRDEFLEKAIEVAKQH